MLTRKQTGDAQNSVAVIVKSNYVYSQLLLINKAFYLVLSYKLYLRIKKIRFYFRVEKFCN